MSTGEIVVAANEAAAPQPAQLGQAGVVATAPAKAVVVAGKGGFSEQPTVGQLVEFQLTGLLVVFVVLGGLTLLSYLIARTLKVVAPNHYFGRSGREQ